MEELHLQPVLQLPGGATFYTLSRASPLIPIRSPILKTLGYQSLLYHPVPEPPPAESFRPKV